MRLTGSEDPELVEYCVSEIVAVDDTSSKLASKLIVNETPANTTQALRGHEDIGSALASSSQAGAPNKTISKYKNSDDQTIIPHRSGGDDGGRVRAARPH